MKVFVFLIIFRVISIPETYNFGEIEEGEVVTAYFWLKNSYNDTIKIREVRPSCGCTYSSSSSNFISPNDSVQFTITFNSEGFSGRVSQYVKINYEGVESGIIYLKMEGTVVKNYLNPEELSRYYVTIIDLRSKEDYLKAHLVGAVWIDKKTFKESFKKLKIPYNVLIVFISNDPKDKELLKYIRREGYGNSYMLRGGFENWKKKMRETLIYREED